MDEDDLKLLDGPLAKIVQIAETSRIASNKRIKDEAEALDKQRELDAKARELVYPILRKSLAAIHNAELGARLLNGEGSVEIQSNIVNVLSLLQFDHPSRDGRQVYVIAGTSDGVLCIAMNENIADPAGSYKQYGSWPIVSLQKSQVRQIVLAVRDAIDSITQTY